jgi:hypothetical protein
VRAVAICQNELVIRTLHQVLTGPFEVDFLTDSRTLGRRLSDEGLPVTVADLKRVDTYVKADVSPSVCVLLEDDGRRSLKKIVASIRDAGGSLIYVLRIGGAKKRKAGEDVCSAFEEVTDLDLGELLSPTLTTELSRSLTRA